MAAKDQDASSSFDAVLASRDGPSRTVTLARSVQKGVITANTACALSVLSIREDVEHDERSATLCHDRYTGLYETPD